MRGYAITLILLLPTLTSAQTPVAWKFKAGDSFTYERKVKDLQATLIKGQTLKQDVQSTWVYRFDVTKIEDDRATLNVTLEQVAIQHAAGPGGLDNKLLEKMKGASLTIVASPRGEISSMSGYDKVVEHMSEKRDVIAKTIRQHYPETGLRQELQQVLALLPRDPLAVGSRWQSEGISLPTPPLGEFRVTLNGVHTAVDRAGHLHLDGTMTGKFERPQQPAEFFRVVGGSLTLDKGRWSCIFDNVRGRAMSQVLSLEMKGELTVEVVGTTTPVEVMLRRDVTTRLVSQNP